MWSRQFLHVGLGSAVGIAAATLGLIWVALAIAFGASPPRGLANLALWSVGGIIAYPVCWYLLVFRRRRCTRARTVLLVIVTYAVTCAPVALLFGALTLRHLSGPTANPAVPPLFGMQLWAAGVILLGVPYAIVATPMAFLHRRFLSTSSIRPSRNRRHREIALPKRARSRRENRHIFFAFLYYMIIVITSSSP